MKHEVNLNAINNKIGMKMNQMYRIHHN